VGGDGPFRVAVIGRVPPTPSRSRAIAAVLLRTGLSLKIVKPGEAQILLIDGDEPADTPLHTPRIHLAREEWERGSFPYRGLLTQVLAHFRHDPQDPLAPYLHTGEETRLRLDLPSLAAANFAGWEEDGHPTDEHGRYPASESVAHHAGLLDRPWLDELCHSLGRSLCRVAGVENPRRASRWFFCASFDIDSAGMFAGRAAARNLRAIGRDRPAALLRAIGACIASRISLLPDPHLKLRELGEALEGLEIPATFFLQSLKAHCLDSYGRPFSPALTRQIQSLSRSGYHDIGLHSSYATRDREPAFLAEQWRHLRRAAKPRIKAVHRAHYLRIPHNGEYGIGPESRIVDSSMAFGEHEGFRRGTAYPFRLPNGAVEMPPSSMDTTFRYFRGLDPGEALDINRAIMARVSRTGGAFVPIWHPNQMEELLFPGWTDGVWDTIRAGKSAGARFAPLAHTARRLQRRADQYESDMETPAR